MGIPETQFDTWSHQGAMNTSRDTYATIRRVLEMEDSPYSTRPFSIFLQGSYGNDTNVYGESDVDIVIQHDGGIFHNDAKELPGDQYEKFKSSYSDGTYTWHQFNASILQH